MFRFHLGAVALAAVCALPLAAAAQSAPQPGIAAPPAVGQQAPATQQQHRHRRSPYLRAIRNLNLSDAQRRQIAGILKGSRAAAKGADPQTRRADMAAMRRQIDGILTPDQRTQLRAGLAQARRPQ